MRNRRKSVFVPALLITVAVLNPTIMVFVNRSDTGKVYWRSLWLIPIIPICAMLPGAIVEASDSLKRSIIACVSFLAVFIAIGSLVYRNPSTSFTVASNPDKLPESTVRVAEALLAMEDEPRVMTDAALSVYLRQYSGKIHSPYSRSVTYGSAETDGQEMFTLLSEGQLSALAQKLANHDYRYLVTNNQADRGKMLADSSDYALFRQVDEYGIYRVIKGQSEEREYNAKGQMIALTYLDSDGRPADNEYGYASIRYAYDVYGNIIEERYFDSHNHRTEDTYGRAGYLRKYNRFGEMTMETFLGVDDLAKQINYATRKREYNAGHQLAREDYLDEQGMPMLRKDMEIAAWKLEYNEKGQVVHELFLDVTGAAKNTAGGYASVDHTYCEDGLPSLSVYRDVKGAYVQCGSDYLHCYLEKLLEWKAEGKAIFISAKDEASSAITQTLMDDLHALGIKNNLRGRYRQSFAAILSPEGDMDCMSAEPIHEEATLDGLSCSVSSGGYLAGSMSSIVIGGVEYSTNVRGLNIVVYDPQTCEVIDRVGFDTCATDIPVTRLD